MVNKILLSFASVLAVASAATSYSVTFYEPVVINGAMLNPGAYHVELSGSTALIKRGKTVTEAPVKVQNEPEKFKTNSVRMDGDRVAEIRVGGTHTRLVFERSGDATN